MLEKGIFLSKYNFDQFEKFYFEEMNTYFKNILKLNYQETENTDVCDKNDTEKQLAKPKTNFVIIEYFESYLNSLKKSTNKKYLSQNPQNFLKRLKNSFKKSDCQLSIRTLLNNPLLIEGRKYDILSNMIMVYIDKEIYVLLENGVFRRAIERYDPNKPSKLNVFNSFSVQSQSYKFKNEAENSVYSIKYILEIVNKRKNSEKKGRD